MNNKKLIHLARNDTQRRKILRALLILRLLNGKIWETFRAHNQKLQVVFPNQFFTEINQQQGFNREGLSSSKKVESINENA